MAWFRNHYECARCGAKWTDEWSCMCDDDCRSCGARHMSPYDSNDLTEIVVVHEERFLVLRSPDSAETSPEYVEVAKFSTPEQAVAYLVRGS